LLAPVPAAAVALVAVLVVAVLAGVLLRGARTASAAGATGGTATVEVFDAGPTTPAEDLTVTSSVLVVDVVGRVHRPGVFRLPAGARVVDAVEAAGGATDGAAVHRINLARPVVDGEQILVPGPDDPLPDAPGSAPGAETDAPVDLNTASATELEELPGIGPVLAGRIVDWRTEHGRFTTVDELREVEGIGDTTMTRLRPLVRV
jgi:competence protein ComEA